MLGDGVRDPLGRTAVGSTGEHSSQVGPVDRTPPSSRRPRRGVRRRGNAHRAADELGLQHASDGGGGDDALVLVAVHASEHGDGRSR